MRQFLAIWTCATLSFFSFAQDPISPEQIVEKYLETIGGADALSALTTHKMTGTTKAQGMTIPLEMYFTKSGKMITKMTVQGMEMTRAAFDGETSWNTNFMSMKPEKATAEESENAKRSSNDYPDPFLNYAEKGYRIELLGEETVEGVDCYKVKLTKQPILVEGKEEENVSFYFFDKENMIPIQVEQELPSGQMKGTLMTTIFSDYQEVDGLVFPFALSYKFGDQMTATVELDSIELNLEIDERIFQFPGEQ